MLLNYQFVFSQSTLNQSSYDQLYYNMAVNLASNSHQESPDITDSYGGSDDWIKIKALLLSADFLVNQNKQAEGIEYALKALEWAKESDDYNYQAIIYGFLSAQCRIIGFYSKGKYYLNEGIIASSKIKDKDKVLQYVAMADHEYAEYAMINKDFTKALHHIQKAEAYYESLEEGPYKSLVLANTQLLIGHCKIGLMQYDSALGHFKNACARIKSAHADNSIFEALIYQSVGESYMKLKEVDSAQIYLAKALRHSESTDNLFIKEKVYASLSSYYRDRYQLDSAITYLTKYNQTVLATRSHNRQQIDMVLGILKENSPQVAHSNWMPVYGLGFLLITIGIGVYAYRKKRNKTAAIKQDGVVTTASKSVTSGLSPQMVEKLSQKLKLFEYEERFLDKTLSISKLATEMETNTKYLKYYLKHHLHTDYPTYINRLRIQFITDELTTNPETRKYTLVYLADISGYGSYSAFAVNFKRFMEQAPSAFIQDLNGYFKNHSPGIAG